MQKAAITHSQFLNAKNNDVFISKLDTKNYEKERKLHVKFGIRKPGHRCENLFEMESQLLSKMKLKIRKFFGVFLSH